jgi:hypothetical protein
LNVAKIPPPNFYAESKKAGHCTIQTLPQQYLILS